MQQIGDRRRQLWVIHVISSEHKRRPLHTRLYCKSRRHLVQSPKVGNIRIRRAEFLNQNSLFGLDLEKVFFAPELKIVLQHNPSNSRLLAAVTKLCAKDHLRRWCNAAELVLESALALACPTARPFHVGHAVSAISGSGRGRRGCAVQFCGPALFGSALRGGRSSLPAGTVPCARACGRLAHARRAVCRARPVRAGGR